MTLHIYDAKNFCQRYLETNSFPVRSLIDRAFYPEPQIWVWDGPGANDARRKLYPNYKKKPPQSYDLGLFKQLDFIRELFEHTPVVQIRIPGFEADDTIAAIARRYRDCFIHSTDRDFLQLGVPNDIKATLPCAVHEVKLYKATVGDPSDKIPGIKGFGEKSWEACPSRASLHEYLILGEDEALPDTGLTQRHLNWLAEPGNMELIRTFYKIVAFMEVPEDLIRKHTIVGKPNRRYVESQLKQFIL